MKRGRRFFENDNLLIYGGIAVFIILAVAIGIIMYMTSKSENGESVGNTVGQNQTVNQDTESASTDIGKTVKEQEGNLLKEDNTNSTANNTTIDTNSNTNTNSNTTTNSSSNTTTQNTTNNTNTTTEKPVNEENKVTETKKEISFVKPVEGEIICEFAKDNLIYSETLKEWITHTAIDIKADKTSVIKSAAAGTVKSIVNDPRYGLTVVIEHDDGYETVYSNLLTAEFVVEGEDIEQGQTIGTAGNTAAFESSMESHLHFELLKDGEYLDPTIYLK